MAEKISLQRTNCNILGLTDTVALLANEARFFICRVFLRACSFQNEVGESPFFFTFLAKADHRDIVDLRGKFTKKYVRGKNFGRERP